MGECDYKLKSSSRDKAALKGFSQYVQNKLVQISKIHTSYWFSIKKFKNIFLQTQNIYKIVVQAT